MLQWRVSQKILEELVIFWVSALAFSGKLWLLRNIVVFWCPYDSAPMAADCLRMVISGLEQVVSMRPFREHAESPSWTHKNRKWIKLHLMDELWSCSSNRLLAFEIIFIFFSVYAGHQRGNLTGGRASASCSRSLRHALSGARRCPEPHDLSRWPLVNNTFHH